MRRHGFSLVELSIVLVILGLLVGGILAGQSLIRAAELRAVTAEYQRYTAAVHAFRDKYFGLPGDITNAEAIWGQVHATDATCMNTASTTTATCNGNGNGSVEVSSTRSREIYAFWKQLANAGLVEGSYTGTYNNSQNWNVLPGSNIPASKMPNAGWAVVAFTQIATSGGWYADMFPPVNSTHWFMVGAVASNALTVGGLLEPEEAWNIDTKLDDGLPGRSKITTLDPDTRPNCASSTTAASATYVLNNTDKNCVLLMGF